jgi:tRNA threonylcarbamoyladenosine biosynthesis protein TsaE
MTPRRWTTTSETETRRVGYTLGKELLPDGVLLLDGDLGAGKTVLARGVAEALGVDPAEVQSPTFVVMREHFGSEGRLLHVDLYRLDPGEVPGVGLEEELAGPGVKVVEWADRLPFEVPAAVRVRLERAGEGTRRIEEV